MNLTPYTIQELTPIVLGNRSGRELIKLFNKFGSKDVYDENGLPDIGKKNGQRPSRTQYVEKRLSDISGKITLRELIEEVVNIDENKEVVATKLNDVLKLDGYNILNSNGKYTIIGGIIDRTPAVTTAAHFQQIEAQILSALDSARVSIRVVMAWFTNETLFNKLVEKHKQGIDVQVAIYDDGVNRKHGVNITQLPHKMLKRGLRGGLMHDKFCVIDNQVVITGSYNWTDNAEFKNDENISIVKDPKAATEYSEEYRRLTT